MHFKYLFACKYRSLFLSFSMNFLKYLYAHAFIKFELLICALISQSYTVKWPKLWQS